MEGFINFVIVIAFLAAPLVFVYLVFRIIKGGKKGAVQRKSRGRKRFGQRHHDTWDVKNEDQQREDRLASLSPAKRKLFLMTPDLPEGEWVQMLIKEGKDQELKMLLQNEVMPKVDTKTREQLLRLGAEDAWATPQEVLEAGLITEEESIDTLALGWGEDPEGYRVPLRFHGEGHLLTIAMTGAGKGQGHILPNLLAYTGSAIVFDPKGEAYKQTAWRRHLYGKVFKWAPYDKTPAGLPNSDSFNPLDYVSNYNDAAVLADLLVDPTNYGRDQFWDRSARDMLIAIILFVKRTRPPSRQNMREVMRWLSASRERYDEMIETLLASDDEILVETANELVEMFDTNMRLGIVKTLRSHLGAWREDEITAVTSATTPGWEIGEFRYAPSTEELMVKTGQRAQVGLHFATDETTGEQEPILGMSRTLYIVVPTYKISSCAPVLRVMLGIHLQKLIEIQTIDEDDSDPENPGRPVLFIFDELPQLGYMKQIETAIATARSAKVRLWLFIQDLNQLRQYYEGWETIIANCRLKSYIKVNDLSTARYIADRIGKVKSLFGGEEYAAPPQEIMGTGFKGEQIIEVPGMKPIRSQLRMFYNTASIQDAVAQKDEIVSVFGLPKHAPTVLEDEDDPHEHNDGPSETEAGEASETPSGSISKPQEGPRPPSFEK